MKFTPGAAQLMSTWLAGVSLYLAASIAPEAATTNRFESDIRGFEAAKHQHSAPAHPVLFVGSSSFRMWTDLDTAFPGFVVLNRGFGGSQLSDVLYYFDRIVSPYRPPLIALYEGDNDLAEGKSVDEVFNDWRTFVARVENDLPGTGILFVAVKPSPSRARFIDLQRALNNRVKENCSQHNHLRFADVFTPMLDAAGQPRPDLFIADMLHLNAAGYELWTSVIAPALEAWATEYPNPSIRRLSRENGVTTPED